MAEYRIKKGNKYYMEFQKYFYTKLTRKERMIFKRTNNYFNRETGYLLHNNNFLQYVKNHIDRPYPDFFDYIIKKERKHISLIVYFD